MKKANARKIAKPQNHEESEMHYREPSPWFNEIRTALSPYWSARCEYENHPVERADHRNAA